jgi:predicted GH43/DUF377 family glycosyl hydrolase
MKYKRLSALIVFSLILNFATGNGQEKDRRKVITAIPQGKAVDSVTMKKIYEEVKTPYKYGIILRSDTAGDIVDCPSIFFYKGSWYMMYVANSKNKGYQTYLAQSNDLLNWKKLGRILSFTSPGKWDAWQDDGGVALCDYRWEGSHELMKYKGKYWMSYLGGAKQGYEPDPLAIGMAWTRKPDKIEEWKRIKQNPVLAPSQPDTRQFESATLYKSQVIYDESRSLGYSFIMYYNGKLKNGYERIGMAVSDDMISWRRYGSEPVVSNGEEKQSGISGDPQIVKIGDVWVMFYFGAFWKPRAFDTFACSYDLVNWTKWEGKHLIEPGEPYDKTYAHKPWVIKWNGIAYHFYCAVGNEGRVIAVATSKDLKK